jgi:transposase
MEACVGSHHLSRRLIALGHDARLMPAQYVKPFLKGHKNDYRDAEARIIEALAADWRRLDDRVDEVSTDIETLARKEAPCQRLMTVPGIGPLISSATVATIGVGDLFSKGRDFSAWLGIVPKQLSTGGRTILGKISKRGNKYLRMLFVQAARVVLLKRVSWERYGLKSWIEAAAKRLHHNKLAIALANKLARIAWAVLHHGRNFEVSHEHTPQPA